MLSPEVSILVPTIANFSWSWRMRTPRIPIKTILARWASCAELVKTYIDWLTVRERTVSSRNINSFRLIYFLMHACIYRWNLDYFLNKARYICLIFTDWRPCRTSPVVVFPAKPHTCRCYFPFPEVIDHIVTMASSGYLQAAMLLLAAQLLCLGAADADQESGTVIPAESMWI